MIRLLITGATGFLGLPCVANASDRGLAVHATARSRHSLFAARFHAADLLEPDSCEQLLAAVQPTHLLHLAWIATPGVYWTSQENFAWVEASQRLLKVFSRHGGKRAVIAGTCAEYDWSAGAVCSETVTPLRPATRYGQCKNELRAWATDYCSHAGIELAWARLFFLYGPNEHPARLVPSIARALLAGEPVDCTSGVQERDFLHTSDAADALVTLLVSDAVGAVNIGSGDPRPVGAVIQTVARACGRPELIRWGARKTPANEPFRLAADVERLQRELHWRPRIDLADGLNATVAWWRARHAA
jgi:nucleoside-diphosphate-sugar epimerase